MKNSAANLDASEKLIRLQACRRDSLVDLRVHYAVSRRNGCSTYQIIAVDEMN